jgi:rubrerythrin
MLCHATVANAHKDKSIRDEENIEADEFAGQFLMPEHLLIRCSYRWPSKVAEQFKVSHTALWQRLNNLKRLDLLSDEEKEKRYIRCCDVCGNSDILFGNTKFCPICGNELNENTWGVLPQHFSGPEAVKNVVMICPRCGANLYHVKSSDCPSCGFPRRNSCINLCFAEISPSDRHCPQCGSKTQYFSEGLLTHWWHAMNTGEMVEEYVVKRKMFRSY